MKKSEKKINVLSACELLKVRGGGRPSQSAMVVLAGDKSLK